jgi:hypothetical protein
VSVWFNYPSNGAGSVFSTGQHQGTAFVAVGVPEILPNGPTVDVFESGIEAQTGTGGVTPAALNLQANGGPTVFGGFVTLLPTATVSGTPSPSNTFYLNYWNGTTSLSPSFYAGSLGDIYLTPTTTRSLILTGNYANANGTLLPSTLTGYNGNASGVKVPLSLAWSTPSSLTAVCHDTNGNLTDASCPGGGGGMTWPTTPGYALWLSGTTWSTPHLTDNSTTVSSSEPFAIVQASNQFVTGTSTNTTTSTYPASSGAVTLTFPNTSEYMVGANSDTTTTHVLHATAVPGVYNSAAIAAGDIPATAVPAVAVPTPSASITLAAPSGIAVCTGTCTVSVPVPAAGYQFCILNDDNVGTAITLSALGSSARYENSARTAYGTAGTGTLVLSAATGNLVCIVGRDSTHYLTTNYVGTVTVN